MSTKAKTERIQDINQIRSVFICIFNKLPFILLFDACFVMLAEAMPAESEVPCRSGARFIREG